MNEALVVQRKEALLSFMHLSSTDVANVDAKLNDVCVEIARYRCACAV